MSVEQKRHFLAQNQSDGIACRTQSLRRRLLHRNKPELSKFNAPILIKLGYKSSYLFLQVDYVRKILGAILNTDLSIPTLILTYIFEDISSQALYRDICKYKYDIM